MYIRPDTITCPSQALDLLVEGNKRFAESSTLLKNISEERRIALSRKGQKPFAALISCSDSRVPSELIFDQALGDLFVIRVAGNVLDAIGLGSVEYAVIYLQVPLIVVLGHEKCGAVQAAIDGIVPTPNMKVIFEKLQPAIKRSTEISNDIYSTAEDENILHAVNELKDNAVVSDAIKKDRLMVIAAKYQIESGLVKLLN